MKKIVLGAVVMALCLSAGGAREEKKEAKKVENRLFEMRTYYAAPGKMKALHKRFNDHTCLWSASLQRGADHPGGPAGLSTRSVVSTGRPEGAGEF